MQTILVVGAGKTSVFLIDYLLSYAQRGRWNVIVADTNLEAITDKLNDHPSSEAAVLDIHDNKMREQLIQKADVVVSLMPPDLHILLAKDCLKHKKHLITSSYVSPEMKALDEEVQKAGVMFMCEMGLDPGIDHMTAHQVIFGIHKVAGQITSFKSYTGGLIAPESDDNPWHYKFTWNPRNVVLAGNAGAKYLLNGKIAETQYGELFANPKKGPKLDGVGALVYYPNRDSIDYLSKYGLEEVKTFVRATYRIQGFMKGWNVLVQLGLTDPNDKVKDGTYSAWIANKNGMDISKPLAPQVAQKLGMEPTDSPIKMVEWLGIFEPTNISVKNASSADILLDVLQSKWAMKPEDKDMIIMRHEVEYLHKGINKTTLTSTMVIKGEDSKRSAMAKTVGLPMAILAKLLLTGKVKPQPGVQIPNLPAIYRPVLSELEEHGVEFKEEID